MSTSMLPTQHMYVRTHKKLHVHGGAFMNNQQMQMINRLLELPNVIAQAEKTMVDVRYELNKMRLAYDIKESDIVLNIDTKKIKNEDQRKAIIIATLKKEKEQIFILQKKYDYARLTWNKYKHEYESLMDVLGFNLPKDMFVEEVI